MVSMDDNILAAVGCVIAVHHDTYLHQLLLLITPFVAKEDTINIRSKRLGKSSLKEKILFGIFVSLPPTAASRTPPHTLRNCSRLGLFRPNLEEISLV
jgi:hypothetical protein